MLVEHGTAPYPTAAPGEAIAPVGLPQRSSICANGAHCAWSGVGGTHTTPSHRVAAEAITSGPGVIPSTPG